METPKTEEEWEKDFDEEMKNLKVNTDVLFFRGLNDELMPTYRHEAIKHFISKVVSQTKERIVREQIERFTDIFNHEVKEKSDQAMCNANWAREEIEYWGNFINREGNVNK